MGFCLFNNVAIAAARGAARTAPARVAIVDWDVHHGNGTQDIFWSDPRCSTSLHQFPLYPGTGAPTRSGAGAGAGTTVNVPLPAGAGDADYAARFDDVVVPALRALRAGARARLGRLRRARARSAGGMRLDAAATLRGARARCVELRRAPAAGWRAARGRLRPGGGARLTAGRARARGAESRYGATWRGYANS